MSIITTAYFTANLELPGRSDLGTDESLELCIGRNEPKFLKGVLGRELAEALIDAWDASQLEVDPVALPDRFADLIEGVEYVVSGVTYKWEGLATGTEVSATLTDYKSPIANYVYFMYRRENETQTGKVGETKAKSQNADPSSANEKMVVAWNEMVDMVGDQRNLWEPETLFHFMDNNLTTYPEWENARIDRNLFTKINTFNL